MGLAHTLQREWGRILERPFYLVVMFAVPLFATLFMATIFGNGRLENIPIGVVDEDFSATTRSITRAIDAAPSLSIAEYYTSTSDALAAMRAKKIYAYVVFPHSFEADLLANRGPTIAYYFHYALMSVGGQVEAALENLLTEIAVEPVVMTATALGLSTDTTQALVAPIMADSMAMFNPTLNYSAYLSFPLLMVMLQIVVMLATAYAVGVEIKSGTAVRWLVGANGNILTAVVGKLLPYTIAFSAAAIGSVAWFYGGPDGLPHGEGSLWLLALWSVLLVVSSQALGLFIFGLFPALGLIISIVSMVGSLGATLCGVTFPIGSLYPAFQSLATLLPIRHFTTLSQNILYGNYGTEWVWPDVVAMMIVCALPIVVLPRLRKAIISRRYEKIS